jgi:hypothetical protein
VTYPEGHEASCAPAAVANFADLSFRFITLHCITEALREWGTPSLLLSSSSSSSLLVLAPMDKKSAMKKIRGR